MTEAIIVAKSKWGSISLYDDKIVFNRKLVNDIIIEISEIKELVLKKASIGAGYLRIITNDTSNRFFDEYSDKNTLLFSDTDETQFKNMLDEILKITPVQNQILEPTSIYKEILSTLKGIITFLIFIFGIISLLVEWKIGLILIILSWTLCSPVKVMINSKLVTLFANLFHKSFSEIADNIGIKISIGVLKFIVFFIALTTILNSMPAPEKTNVETTNNTVEQTTPKQESVKPTQEHKKEKTEQPQTTVEIASSKFQTGLQEILNRGYQIAPETKVYYARAKNYKKVYFFGALVEKNGQYYNAMWETNDMTSCGAGLVFSMNDYAIESSGMADGRTKEEPFATWDDAYSNVNHKIVELMTNAVEKQRKEEHGEN